MENWGLTEWLWLIGIVVAIILGIGAIVATRRSANPRRKLQFLVNATPLVSEHSRGRGLVVSYNDEPVQDPYLVRVTLKNIGAIDITSADFDAGRDLEVCVEPDGGMDMVPERPGGDILDVLDFQLLEPDGSRNVSNEVLRMGPRSVPISPMLLRRNTTITLDLLVDGPVFVYLKNPLINTDEVRTTATERSVAVLDAVATGTATYALGGAAGAAAAALMNRATAGRRSRDGSRR
ncbi:hypothetical protein D6T65_10325 [Arthrobacter frigidicola]|nr:hypothetical protein D6T65_10325 [Arthrobacter frigidicola]